MGNRWNDGYSSDVDIYLIVAGGRIDVAEVGPDSFVINGEFQLPAGTEAELVITVDQSMESYSIVLHEGICAGQERVAYSIAVPF